jgi:hypothetical protein
MFRSLFERVADQIVTLDHDELVVAALDAETVRVFGKLARLVLAPDNTGEGPTGCAPRYRGASVGSSRPARCPR